MGVFRAEVERGAAFLDKLRPGWREVINVDRLDLSSCPSCVLGQLVGADTEALWEDILGEFGIDEESDLDYGLGFNALSGYDEDWACLTAEWRAYIRETRVSGGVV